ncbi:MAG: winged helix-turn-helix domain-containing protein [Archaeoglobaceae archaeon]
MGTDIDLSLDNRMFEALSSGLRVEILKRLKSRQMTATEISKELDVSKSTAIEHLRKLVEAELVIRRDDGRKWIYYSLSDRGKTILHKKELRVKILFSFATILMLSGVVQIYAFVQRLFERLSKAPILDAKHPPEVPYLYIATHDFRFLTGVALVIGSITVFYIAIRKYRSYF